MKTVEEAGKAVVRSLEVDEQYGPMRIKVPLASKELSFRQCLADRKPQGRDIGGSVHAAMDDGIRDVFNVDCRGQDEVMLVNDMIPGDADLIAWEKEQEVSI